MDKPKHAFLYCRVSTSDQNTAGQEAELRAYAKARKWRVAKVYRDTISGGTNSRPALNQLMADVRHRSADIVVLVWKFDRFARSVSHLLEALETFRELGVDFVSLTEAIDSGSAMGRAMFTILAALSELERSVIRDRVRMGLENARRHGKVLGRPPIKKLGSAEIRQVRAERARGTTLRALAKRHDASLWSVYQAVKS
jgi:DNA invertase Pin-like site-specific DNA recombinase